MERVTATGGSILPLINQGNVSGVGRTRPALFQQKRGRANPSRMELV